MNFLTDRAIRDWYYYSLRRSGFDSVEPMVNELWKKLALSGMYAVPPGFLAALMSKLAPIEIGKKNKEAPPFNEEERLINLIVTAKGAERLNKVFFVINLKNYKNNMILSMEQIIRKLPLFEHQEITFVETEFERALLLLGAGEDGDTSGPEEPDTLDLSDEPNEANEKSSRFTSILEQVYINLTEKLTNQMMEFTEEDIFEITYPRLFTQTASKLFYRIMNHAMKSMEFWLRDTHTLKEESSWVVIKYGEPQTLSIGGYNEITNKGTISSMLTSELAYMDDTMDFDLFDYKFSENQLLYFNRDTSSIYRIRRNVIIKIAMTEFFEHEKNLGLLFATVYSFATKLIETYFKDMVNVSILVEGYKPTSMPVATSFFSHFLAIKKYNDRIDFHILKENKSAQDFITKDSQVFIFSNAPIENYNYINFVYPQNDEFAQLSQSNQEKILGQLISSKIKKMVNTDYDLFEHK